MEINLTPEHYVTWFSEIFQTEPEISDGNYLFNVRGVPISLEVEDISTILNQLSQLDEYEDTAILDLQYFEVLVREEAHLSSRLTFRLREDAFVRKDEENDITYTLANPSDKYLLFLIFKLANIAPIRESFRFLPPSTVLRRMGKEENESTISALDVLRHLSLGFMTLKIETGKPKSVVEFKRYMNSFLFKFSFNFDTAIVEKKYFDEFIRTSRIRRLRRSRIEDFEAPRRFYEADLTRHYQLAIASDSPPLEFLSYYHVAEHFFESVFESDLIERVRYKITQPDFSYKRKRDIRSLINEISNSLKIRGDSVTFSEIEALRLTIQRFVDINILIEKLQEYDDTLIAYYRDNPVEFSNGDKINFEDSDVSNIYTAMAKRIYKTRNAIVHSKEGDRGRYIPFEHDKVLVKEVPLLRFLIELIIVETSTVMS